MMKKSYWIKCVAAVALCLTAASCTKIGGEGKTQEFTQNFDALVMGGKDIDPVQDWNTVGNIQVKINVDFGNDQTYRVYITQAPPLLTSDATFIGMARVKSGESKTINVSKPANCGLLYAACYDDSGHAMCQPFQAKASGTEVSFKGKSLSEAPTASTGNAWSVDIPELPDLSPYTTGNLIEASTAESQEIGDEPLRIKISSPYTGFIPSLGLRPNKSVYVTSSWELSFNQQVAYGNAIVVGYGGTLNVPQRFMLSTAPSGEETNGLIYVLPGGKITGDGTVDFVTSEGTFCYNAGSITAKTIQINGGKDNVIEGNRFIRCATGVSFTPWSKERWEKVKATGWRVKRDADTVGTLTPLYLEKYPSLRADPVSDVSRNFIRRNVFEDCGRLFCRENGRNVIEGNEICTP